MPENLFHLGFSKEQTAKYAILPGDPERVDRIANHLDNPKFVCQNREFRTFEGEIDQEKVLVTSTGIGGPSAAIATEELYMAGVRNFIRVGTCGGMQEDVKSGDLVIATAAVRMEGTSKEYAPIEYPAAADFQITTALAAAAQHLKIPYHTGVVQSKDSFYGQHSPKRMPISYELINKWQALKGLGCLSSEMETAAIFTVCSSLGARAGAVLHVIWNQTRAEKGLCNPTVFDASGAVRAAVEAVRILLCKP